MKRKFEVERDIAVISGKKVKTLLDSSISIISKEQYVLNDKAYVKLLNNICGELLANAILIKNSTDVVNASKVPGSENLLKIVTSCINNIQILTNISASITSADNNSAKKKTAYNCIHNIQADFSQLEEIFDSLIKLVREFYR